MLRLPHNCKPKKNLRPASVTKITSDQIFVTENKRIPFYKQACNVTSQKIGKRYYAKASNPIITDYCTSAFGDSRKQAEDAAKHLYKKMRTSGMEIN